MGKEFKTYKKDIVLSYLEKYLTHQRKHSQE